MVVVYFLWFYLVCSYSVAVGKNKPDFLDLFLGNVFQKHKESGADITLSCVPMDEQVTLSFHCCYNAYADMLQFFCIFYMKFVMNMLQIVLVVNH